MKCALQNLNCFPLVCPSLFAVVSALVVLFQLNFIFKTEHHPHWRNKTQGSAAVKTLYNIILSGVLYFHWMTPFQIPNERIYFLSSSSSHKYIHGHYLSHIWLCMPNRKCWAWPHTHFKSSKSENGYFKMSAVKDKRKTGLREKLKSEAIQDERILGIYLENSTGKYSSREHKNLLHIYRDILVSAKDWDELPRLWNSSVSLLVDK